MFPWCNFRLWGETGKRSDGNGQCKEEVRVGREGSIGWGAAHTWFKGGGNREAEGRERNTVFDCSQQIHRLKAPKKGEEPLGSVRGRGHPCLCKLCDLKTVGKPLWRSFILDEMGWWFPQAELLWQSVHLEAPSTCSAQSRSKVSLVSHPPASQEGSGSLCQTQENHRGSTTRSWAGGWAGGRKQWASNCTSFKLSNRLSFKTVSTAEAINGWNNDGQE